MIDRIFSGAVTRGRKLLKDVWFLFSEEDKTTPTIIEYWFRCMDLDGDSVLSMFELDLVTPRVPGKITLQELKRCKMASLPRVGVARRLGVAHEEPAASEGPALMDWDKDAAEEEAAGEPWDDRLAPDPAEEKLFQSPLGAVELYEFADDDHKEEEDADDL